MTATRAQQLQATARTYALLEAALSAESLRAAADAVLPDLEVLPREELLRIAFVALVDLRRFVVAADRQRFLVQLRREQAALIWEADLAGIEELE